MALGLGQGWDNISIHAPREGCDYFMAERFFLRGISIHAPREGCDERAA